MGLVAASGCQTYVSGTLYYWQDSGKPIAFFITNVVTVCPVFGGFRINEGGAGNGNREARPVAAQQKSPNQLLAQCYANAAAGYIAAGNTTSQKVVDGIKSLSPLSIIGGIKGLAEGLKDPGIYKTFNQGQIVAKIGEEGKAVSGLRGFGKGILGIGTGFLGSVMAGISIGSTLTVLGDATIGREGGFTDAIKECNSGSPDATDKVNPSFFQIFQNNFQAVVSYIQKNG